MKTITKLVQYSRCCLIYRLKLIPVLQRMATRHIYNIETGSISSLLTLRSIMHTHNWTFHNDINSIHRVGTHIDQHQYRNQSTYVSKHNTSLTISSTDIIHQFTLHLPQPSTIHRITQTHVILHTCPFCPNPTNKKPDNLYKLYVQIGGGAYFCHRCGGNGSWYDLKRRLSGKEVPKTMIKEYNIPSNDMHESYTSNLLKHYQTLRYLNNTKGLTKDTLIKYGVGLATYNDEQCLTYPLTSVNKEGPFTLCRIKAYPIHNPTRRYLDPPAGPYGLFGYHTIPSNDIDLIVLTENEVDAMSIYQSTGNYAVALPDGHRILPIDVLPLLERFTVIILWLHNNSGAGFERSETFARKLGILRTRLVKQSPPANIALVQNINLQNILNQSSLIKHEGLVTFTELRDRVLYEIRNPDTYMGVPVKSLPRLTDILKGFRRGELTVLTGSTGSGKTTLLGQLSIDFAEQGINTLWGSFEIKNTRLLQKLLRQYARSPLPTIKHSNSAIAKLKHLADQFQNLPLYFLKFQGGSDVDEVIDAMEYASYVHDVEHVILDNMQFMLSTSKQTTTKNKFDMQDDAISKFRKFASNQNVHVILVVHPRKENDDTRLGISSVFGGAKATQEADTVLILQVDGWRKCIEVKKNRFDGTLGTCPVVFLGESGRYTDGGRPKVVPG